MNGDDRTIIVFDFETNGLDTSTLFPLQIAAMAFDPIRLEPIQVNGSFNSLMRPSDMDKLDDTPNKRKALEINKKTRAMIEAAPDEAVVWKRFCEWCYQFNKKGKSIFSAPIPAGQNIDRFDIPIAQRLCSKYGNVSKDGMMDIFSPMTSIDLKNILFHWFHGSSELENLSMDASIRPYFGLSKEGGHDALFDVQQTAAVIMRFQKYARKQRDYALAQGHFKGSFKDWKPWI
jgi:DNA polymerase III epsilon subunit-like protein